MQVVISIRHGKLSDRQEQAVREQFGRLSRYESRISRLEITLSEEKNHWEVEALASVDRAEPVHAHGEDGDVKTAIDRTVERMARQLKKLRSRHVDHQGPGKERVVRMAEDES